MNDPSLTFKLEPALEAELARFRQHWDLLDKTELIAHIGHYEWSYELACVLSCSEQYARIHDMSVEQVLQAHGTREGVLRQIHPDDLEQFKSAWQVLGREHSVNRDYRLVCDSGEIRHIREFAVEVNDDQGVAIGAFGILQDVSDTVKYELDLEYRDELARQTETITDIGHFIYDEDNECYDYVSEGCARIYGSTPEAYKRKMRSVKDDLADIFDEDRYRVAEEYRDFIASGEDCALEYRIVRADGSIRWVRELGRAKVIRDGRVRETLGVVQDITQQKSSEQELLYKDALANQAETITDIGHFIYDEIKQKYLFVSPGLARIYGLEQSEITRRILSWECDSEMVHPDDCENVRKAYESFLAGAGEWQVDYRMIRADGELRWIREMGRAYLMNHGIPEQTIGVLQDITAQKKAEQEILEAKENLERQVVERTRELANTVKQLQEQIAEREKIAAELDFLANHDALTGLPSLRLCKDRLEQSLAEARRNRQSSAVMFLDLDGFKSINDEHGHEFGDQVLKSIAQRIRIEMRETDTVARIGGDEFVIILSSLPNEDIAGRIAAGLLRQIAQPIEVDGIEVEVSVSIGIAFYPRDGTTAAELIRSADKAMYRVKHDGKNSFGLFQAMAP
ncbi:MAG TPA: diguanylate cyclase [Gammaproteobacteria bacterium]|nr:diguanylate cyclase [Gammaproteobacteria bacterium]